MFCNCDVELFFGDFELLVVCGFVLFGGGFGVGSVFVVRCWR